MRRGALAAGLALALTAAPVATCTDATPARVAALATRALTDPGALAALRSVDRIGGRPVAMSTLLAASGPQLAARLRVLAAAERPTTTASLPAPRAAARTILAERRFRGSDVPRPLHRPLAWLGGELHRIGRGLGSAYDRVVAWLPGGAAAFWTLAGAAVVAVAAAAVVGLGRRAGGRLLDAQPRTARRREADVGRLERDADTAERQGDFERALRLRFQAGLIRLRQAEAIPSRGSLTNGQIARRLDSGAFSGLAADFDEVVYGGREAVPEDAARARSGWRRVLEEERRR